MARYTAAQTLLAPREDVWAFLSEPYNLSDWWPGLAGVEPDRRGFAPGARWRIQGNMQPRLFRSSGWAGVLLVLAVERPSRFAFQLVQDRVDVELGLAEEGPDRTSAVLEVEGPGFGRPGRRLPQQALARLYDLCQTGAEP